MAIKNEARWAIIQKKLRPYDDQIVLATLPTKRWAHIVLAMMVPDRTTRKSYKITEVEYPKKVDPWAAKRKKEPTPS